MAQPNHTDMVIETVLSSSAAAVSRLAASWRRSLVKHGLDPSNQRAPDRVDASGLRLRRSALDRLMTIAAPRLDQLFGLVGNSGCCVLLTDSDGVVLDQRAGSGDADIFEGWGLCTGAVWSEAAEGTNGIGTCLAERRQVAIHRAEHFFARNTAMTELTLDNVQKAALDFAALDPGLIVISGDADHILPQLEAIGLTGVKVLETATSVDRAADAVLQAVTAVETGDGTDPAPGRTVETCRGAETLLTGPCAAGDELDRQD